MLFNRTTLNKLAETERLTIKFVNCQERIRCRLEPRVICVLNYLWDYHLSNKVLSFDDFEM